MTCEGERDCPISSIFTYIYMVWLADSRTQQPYTRIALPAFSPAKTRCSSGIRSVANKEKEGTLCSVPSFIVLNRVSGYREPEIVNTALLTS